jgi:putative SOS response-associated peptidase YedK
MHWGLIPSWAKEPDIGNRLINARSETVSEKPSFRSAFKRRRCLVPTDGFYEWQRLNKRKQPHYIRMGDGEPFAFAGLWEHWEGQDETVIESCAILTTEANAFVRPIHNRMPVIVEPGNYDLWLEAEPDRTGALAQLMRPFSGDRLTAFPISTWVNSPKNDDARCVEPIEHPKD